MKDTMKTEMSRADVNQYVTDRMVERLEQGEVPWINTRAKPLLCARSFTTGKQYRGVNAFLLSMANGASPFWATFNTIKQAGGNVKKGSKSQIAVFWKLLESKEVDSESGEKKHYPVLRYYNVFSLDSCEGLTCPLLDETNIADPIEAAESIIAGYTDKPAITFGQSGKAFYSPAEDRVVMPQRSHFTSAAAYYRTYFHELSHSVGAKSRLNRWSESDAQNFGNDERGLEELTAELAAAMLLAHAGLYEDMEEKSASYLSNWKQALQADSKLIVRAAGAAQRACDYILNRSAITPLPQAENAPVAAPEPAVELLAA
jgi:antirestriction protein ArdC